MIPECRTCHRRAWDGGGALNDRECSEPDGALCKAIALLHAIVNGYTPGEPYVTPSEQETMRIARAYLVETGALR
jgi:hypothetical protein